MQERYWYCVRSKVRGERLALAQLSDVLGVECYLPLVMIERVSRSGKRRTLEPLFPGYLFVKVDLAYDLRKVRYARGVLSFVQQGERIPSLSDSEIAELMALCDALNGDERGELTIQVGDSVDLVGNLFHGTSGRVVDLLAPKNRVRVLIEFLGRATEVWVPTENVLKG